MYIVHLQLSAALLAILNKQVGHKNEFCPALTKDEFFIPLFKNKYKKVQVSKFSYLKTFVVIKYR